MDAKECLEILENPQVEQYCKESSSALLKAITANSERISLEGKPKRASMIVNALLGLLTLTILAGGTMTTEIFGIIMLVVIIMLNIKAKKKVEAQIAEADKNLDECMNNLESYKSKIHEVIPFLHEEYCTPGAINTLKTYFKSGRADTLKEALNLYENELALQKQQDTIDNLQSQLDGIQQSAKNAETASAISAVGSTLNLFK